MESLSKTVIARISPLPDHFKVCRFTPSYQQNALQVFIKTFCDAEPMTKFINMQYDEFYPFASRVIEKALLDELSAIIINEKTNEVVALALVEDLTEPLDLSAVQLTPKFNPIFTLLEQLSSEYFKSHPAYKNEIAHLFISAVKEEYRGLHLSTHVNFYAMKISKERGFHLMVSELTNFINEKGIIPHLSGEYERIGRIVYDKFKLGDTFPFQHLENEAHAYLWKLPDMINEAEQC